MRVTVDPNVEEGGFGYAAAGQYRLKVVKVEQKVGPQAPYLSWTLEISDPTVQTVTGKGKVGHVYEITTLKSGENAQFRLKQLCNALGRTWGDFDTDEVIGCELDAVLGIEEYQSIMKNKVEKFIPVKQA
jgi:hypothetical protein